MKLIEIIKAYIQQKDTDFAILINGNWGSGKTYFLKNEVTSEIAKIPCPITEKETKNFQLVYVSLYGITSSEELQKQIFLEVNPILKTKFSQAAGIAFNKFLGVFKSSLSEKEESKLLNIFGGIPPNMVLVFDDLERLPSKILNEVLGFINRYTEHQKLKVIIIADEEKIKEILEDGYNRIKEKLIRFTYLFNPELKDIIPSFIKRYSMQEYRSYLTLNADSICDLFEKGTHKNLRSLRFVLDLFDSVFTTVSSTEQIEQKHRNIILERLLLFFATYSIEYKKNENVDNLQALETISTDLSNPPLDKAFINMLLKGMDDNEHQPNAPLEGVDKFKDDFENNYFAESMAKFQYFDFIVKYIHSGDLDLKELKNACLKMQEQLKALEEKPELIAFEKLKNCLLLNDEEFEPLIESIYSYVDQGAYQLELYPVIFQNILYCSLNGLANLKIDDALVKRFKVGMDESKKLSAYNFRLKGMLFSLNQENNPLLIEICSYALEVNNSLQSNDDKNLAVVLFDAFEKGNIDKFEGIFLSDSYKSIPVFQIEFFAPETFFQCYSNLDNRMKVSVNAIFERSETRFVYYKDALRKELDFFRELLQHVDRKVGEDDIKKQLSTFSFIRLRDFLRKTVDILSAK